MVLFFTVSISTINRGGNSTAVPFPILRYIAARTRGGGDTLGLPESDKFGSSSASVDRDAVFIFLLSAGGGSGTSLPAAQVSQSE